MNLILGRPLRDMAEDLKYDHREMLAYGWLIFGRFFYGILIPRRPS